MEKHIARRLLPAVAVAAALATGCEKSEPAPVQSESDIKKQEQIEEKVVLDRCYLNITDEGNGVYKVPCPERYFPPVLSRFIKNNPKREVVAISEYDTRWNVGYVIVTREKSCK